MKRTPLLPILPLGLLAACPAQASQYRRPGLGGVYSRRQLTTPYNGLTTIFGPVQTPTLGQRFNGFVSDGGIGIENKEVRGTTEPGSVQGWARLGTAFGITPHFEAGALFLPIQLGPEVLFGDFPAYLTYGWTFGPLDLGLRLSMLTPVQSKAFSINPGVPILLRLGKTRIDSELFINVTRGTDPHVGLGVPLRISHNLTSRIFFGGETGFYEEAFGRSGTSVVPFGLFGGYTTLWGKRVVDFTTSFNWDELFQLDPGGSEKTIQPTNVRFQFGITLHQLVL